MKPQKDSDEMEEKQLNPRELFTNIALLVTEARTPDFSPKGRIEGPHCPPVRGVIRHECDRHKLQCRKASELVSIQEVLWQNRIPMRIDVLLFPNCKHGQQEAMIIEGASFSCMDQFELLERWDVQMVKKRSSERLEGFVNGLVHLQVIRSYVHFSQLSSWLISSQGCLPVTVVYRIYAPGEAVGYTFSHLPEVHNFPSAEMDSAIMQTTVAYLPRQEKVFKVICRSQSPSLESHLRMRKTLDESKIKRTRKFDDSYSNPMPSTSSEVECDGKNRTNAIPQKQKTSTSCAKHYGSEGKELIKQKPPIGRKYAEIKNSQSKMTPCPMSHTPKRKVDQLSPTMKYAHEYPNVSSSSQSNENNLCRIVVSSAVAGASNNDKCTVSCSMSEMTSVCDIGEHSNFIDFKTPLKVGVKGSMLTKPTNLTVSTNNAFIGTKRLPSPKVLVTGSRKPEPSLFKKRCIDLHSPGTSAERAEDYVISTPLKAVEELTSSEFHDLIKPLSPSDLEAYLSSLSNKASKRPGFSKLDDIPTTKCSFYLEEGIRNELVENSLNGAKETGFDTKVGFYTQSLSNNQTDDMEYNLSKGKSHVRKLFDEGEIILSNDFETNIKNSSKPSISKNGFSEKLVFSEKNEGAFTDNEILMEPSSLSGEITTLLYSREVTHPKTQRDITIHTSSKEEATLNEEEDLPKSREIISSAFQMEVTLKNHSIPCNVGAIKADVSDLAQNIESMEIDESPYCHLDKEVEDHLKNSDPEKVFKKPCVDTQKSQEHVHTSSESSTNDTDCEKSTCDENVSSARSKPIQPLNQADNCDTTNSRDLSLCMQLLQRDFQQNVKNEMLRPSSKPYKSLPSPDDIKQFHFTMGRSTSAIFNSSTGLPSRSSPAPVKKKSSTRFDYDCSLSNIRAIKNAISCSKLTLHSEDNSDTIEDPKVLSTSAPASTNCLLGNFEESVLNGRIEPIGVVEGFTVEIGAGGTFCPKHVTLPVVSYFFQLSDDNAPSPYLGYVNLEPLGKRGYHIPRNGTVQVTLFNPNKSVIKMFVVMYDMSDMPSSCQTFLRQRTMYMPVEENTTEPSFLRYLIHLRFQSSKSGKIYLHTDVRLIFARDKFEFDPRVGNYELRSFTEGPENPKFSPKR
ncbi:atos homolog protein A-like isoform X2 [Mya arenaria]|uniref:atos homolog protein A-like isoform X2 n=1 Tax=Mya arenaria TaxID=6604 RepID=UPI0022E3BFAE|nr:atos homolog protein A-like isoform X2 [Mya arenaria]